MERVHELLSKIPPEANVSAQSPFVPHLALRDNIYEFPMIKDASFIVYSEKEDFYNTSKQEFQAKTDSLKASKDWEVLFDDELIILKRN